MYPDSLTLPELTNLGVNNAFYRCEGLLSVVLPKITSVTPSSFGSCYNIVTADFPIATDLGNSCLTFSTKLESVNIPLVRNIGDQAFFNSSIPAVNAPEALTLARGAFRSAYYLATLTAPKLQTLGERCLSGTSLVNLDIPVATSIGKYAFLGASRLKHVNMPNVTALGESLDYQGVFDRSSDSRSGLTVNANIAVAEDLDLLHISTYIDGSLYNRITTTTTTIGVITPYNIEGGEIIQVVDRPVGESYWWSFNVVTAGEYLINSSYISSSQVNFFEGKLFASDKSTLIDYGFGCDYNSGTGYPNMYVDLTPGTYYLEFDPWTNGNTTYYPFKLHIRYWGPTTTTTTTVI